MEKHIEKIERNKEDDTDRTKWCNAEFELSRNVR